jgi:arylsulfatase A-like enzyme
MSNWLVFPRDAPATCCHFFFALSEAGERSLVRGLLSSVSFLLTLLLLSLGGLLAGSPHSARAQLPSNDGEELPNVVLVYADDMGLELVSAFNDRLGFETPHVDRLVSEGVSFTNAHSSASICSPSRYTLLTGRYHWRTRLKQGNVGQWGPPLIQPSRETLPELMQAQGYRTAMLGKWHLGWHWPAKEGGTTENPDRIDFSARIEGGPVEHGFDSYFGPDIINYAPFGWWSDDRIVSDLSEILRDDRSYIGGGPADRDWAFSRALPRLVDRAGEYIFDHANGDQPFFLYFSMTSPHDPIVPSEPYRGVSGKSKYVDFVLETDAAVGEILETLSAAGVRDRTIIVFMGDNGTSLRFSQPEQLREKEVQVSPVYREGKGSIYEGGTRTPFVVSWPEHFPAGKRVDLPVSQVDLYATLSALTGSERSAGDGVDSFNLLPVLKGERETWQSKRYVVTHSAANGGHYAIRDGTEKLVVKPTGVELYDLEENPGETSDLSGQRPERVGELLSALRRIVESGRSTPGLEVDNYRGAIWWDQLPWDHSNEQ